MLLDHNKEAYDAVKAMLLEHRECCLIAATGIGKSNIATELIKELNLNALIIAPKRSIRDNWAEMPDKYGFPATISTVTYQYFARHYRKMYGFDIYIFDEAHHAASEKWGQAIKNFRSELDVEFVLGLTADPERYSDKDIKNRNVAISVFNDHVVYGHSTDSAVKNGILPKATYVCALFDTKGIIEQYEQKQMTDELRGRLCYTKTNCESIESIIRRNIPKNTPVKGIVFVDSINNIDIGVRLARRSFPKEAVHYIHSDLSAFENAETLEMFKKAKSGFIVTVDMLNEGVHINGINTIIMLRKTSSPTIYTQQIGRGLAAHGQDVTIFDLVRNDTSIKKVLSRIHDMEEEINPEEIEDGNGGEQHRRISDQSIIKDYATDILKVLDDIDNYNKKYRDWSEEEDNIIRENYPTMGSNVYTLLSNRTRCAVTARAAILNISFINRWRPEEDKILIEMYPSIGSEVYKYIKGRTKLACKRRALILGVTYDDQDKWTPEEDDILIKHYPIIGRDVASMLTNRSKNACKHRARALGIQYDDTTSWSQEEDQIIIDNYPTMGSDIYKLLPGRSVDSCYTRARKLGVLSLKQRPWTEEEDEILRKNYPTMGSAVYNMLEGRTEMACMARSGILGIKCEKYRDFTKEEDEIIRNNYQIMGGEVFKLLKNRTRNQCSARARYLGIKFRDDNRPWTLEEDEVIRNNYKILGSKVSNLLPGRTAIACMTRAYKLGIRRMK